MPDNEDSLIEWDEKSNVEKLFGPPFEWSAWTSTIMSVWRHVLLFVKEGRLTTPVEVLITSATEEPLVHVRFLSASWEKGNALELLQSDESKWQSPEIFPVSVIVSDAAGVEEDWEVDPRQWLN